MPQALAALPGPLLGPGDPAPVELREGPSPRLVVICDHGGRAVPAGLGRLGLPEAELLRHIAWDIGARDIARRLAERTGATLVAGVYSRLVIDLNRYPHDPSAIAETSDLTEIPGNRGLSPADRFRRLEEIHRPYHAAVAAALAARPRALLLSVHTMTDRPRRTGALRREAVAVSWCVADGVASAALAALRALAGVTVGDNTPYGLDPGEDFSTPEHAIRAGRPHLQIEIRQDLVATRGAAEAWADRLLPALEAALAAAGA